MEARAQARYVRVTPMKARRVIDLIRGMNAGDAQAVLTFAPQAASEPIGKVLASAIANATNNYAMDARALVISAAFVDEGPTQKRIRPRAQGRAYRIRKRSSHITVVVSDGREVVLREMTASDLLFIEKLSNAGDMERSLKLAARLSTNAGKITFDELQKLKMRDLRKVTDLLGKAGGSDDDEDPND